MSKLTEYKLDELYEMGSGISTKPEQAGHGAPFVSFSSIYNNAILPDELPDLMDTTKEEQKKYSVKKGDILLTRTSETLDELAMSSVAVKDYPNATFSGFAKRLRPLQDNVTYDKFMAYFMRSDYFRKIVNCKAVMTLRASFNEEIFSYIKVLLPDYDQQVKSGDLFWDIEQKIRNNNKINAELESMARTIYDYWFLQFDFPDENGKPYKSSGGKMVLNEELKREIPEGWKVKKIGDVAELYQPQTIGEKDFVSDGAYNVYGANGIVGKYNKYNHVNNEIAICCRGASCGRFLMTQPYSWITGNAMVVAPKEQYGKEYIYYGLSYEKISPFITGSAQPQITRANLENMLIVIPDGEIVKLFEESALERRKYMQNIFRENQELTSLRDFLLPLLMNGQVGFKN